MIKLTISMAQEIIGKHNLLRGVGKVVLIPYVIKIINAINFYYSYKNIEMGENDYKTLNSLCEWQKKFYNQSTFSELDIVDFFKKYVTGTDQDNFMNELAIFIRMYCTENSTMEEYEKLLEE